MLHPTEANILAAAKSVYGHDFQTAGKAIKDFDCSFQAPATEREPKPEPGPDRHLDTAKEGEPGCWDKKEAPEQAVNEPRGVVVDRKKERERED